MKPPKEVEVKLVECANLLLPQVKKLEAENARFSFSNVSFNDGYVEVKMSLREQLPPILLLRAVLNSNGKHSPVVRCAQSGKLLSSRPPREDKYEALLIAAETAVKYILPFGA